MTTRNGRHAATSVLGDVLSRLLDLPGLEERFFANKLIGVYAAGQELAELTEDINGAPLWPGSRRRNRLNERLEQIRSLAATLLLLADDALTSNPIRPQPRAVRKA
jgi:hypothetical protein